MIGRHGVDKRCHHDTLVGADKAARKMKILASIIRTKVLLRGIQRQVEITFGS